MTLANYIRAMPKFELHVHLEGTVQPDTLFKLATRNNINLPASSITGLKSWYTFQNFDHFIEIFTTISKCLRTADDFELITYEYGQSMARQNIRYAEITWTPYTHIGNHNILSWEDLLDGINTGRDRAQREWGVEMRWIPDIVRGDPQTATQVVTWLTSPAASAGGVVALGLGGAEIGFPPELFEDAFHEAVSQGLHSNPHAGETVGPASVWGAIRTLKAERIGHGVRAIEDPKLIAYLVEHQIPLEVNPTSNLCLGVYPSYADHPLRKLVEAGVCVTINSDDPALFNTTLNAEYLHAVQKCGLSIDQLEQVALNAVHASYLPEPEKAEILQSFRTTYAQLRHQHSL